MRSRFSASLAMVALLRGFDSTSYCPAFALAKLQPSKPRFLRTVFAAVAILSFLSLADGGQAFGASESILWSFGNGSDGINPWDAPLIMDKNGNLYGTTTLGGAYGNLVGVDGFAGGTVFELTPPSTVGGKWTESILWNFGNGTDGLGPEYGLIMDASGNLYGTTDLGGTHGDGTVFQLTPSSTVGAEWTELILWSFGNVIDDGSRPDSSLTMDASGNVYGATEYGGTYLAGVREGTVFQLAPPSTVGGGWTESILRNFNNSTGGFGPDSVLTMEPSGNLYGTTGLGGSYDKGTAFELAPPSTFGSEWTESTLWSFGKSGPLAGRPSPGGTIPNSVIMDTSGNLYGTTAGAGGYNKGTVFALAPPSTVGDVWTESILWTFGFGTDGSTPFSGLIMDKSGNLFGTTVAGGAYDKGTVFELAPPSTVGGKWTESILWTFGNDTDGRNPFPGLIMDKGGNLYGTTAAGGTYGNGTVFEINTANTGPGRISVSALSLKLSAPAGTSTTGTVTITNVGMGTLTGNVGSAGGAFNVSGNPGAFALGPGSNDVVTVQFNAPAKKRAKSKSSFAITSSDQTDNTIMVKLIGKSR